MAKKNHNEHCYWLANSASWKQPSYPWVPSPSTWVASGFIYLHFFFLPWPNYMLKLDQKASRVPQTWLGLTTSGSVTYSRAWLFTLELPTNRITQPYDEGMALGERRLGRVIRLAHPSKWHIADSGPLTVWGNLKHTKMDSSLQKGQFTEGAINAGDVWLQDLFTVWNHKHISLHKKILKEMNTTEVFPRHLKWFPFQVGLINQLNSIASRIMQNI